VHLRSNKTKTVAAIIYSGGVKTVSETDTFAEKQQVVHDSVKANRDWDTDKTVETNVHDTRIRNRRRNPVPENWYHQPARKYSMSYWLQKPAPKKFGTKLHVKCVRSRYRFSCAGVWRRFLVNVS